MLPQIIELAGPCGGNAGSLPPVSSPRISSVPHILALDQGTSSSRAIVLDASGRVLGASRKEFAQHYPRPGWVEHDADEIWTTTRDAARRALKDAGLSARDLAAIGITNQRETVVLWDRETGRPLHNAIVWQDRRTAPAMERLRGEGAEPAIRRKTGLLLDPYFSGSKLRWLLDHVPGARKKAAAGRLAAGTVDSWLVYNLTGGGRHVTDVSNASRTMLMNLRTGRWDPELARLLGVPLSVLPEIVPSGGHAADTAPAILGASVPVTGILGDQQAALFGQLCTRPGLVKCTYGTGCFLLMFTGAKPVASRHRLLSTVAWRIGEGPIAYALEGSVFVGGRGRAVAARRARRSSPARRRSTPSPRPCATPAASWSFRPSPASARPSGTRPPAARSSGLTRGSTGGHVARATLEGIAFQVADLTTAMEADTGASLREVRVDGGAAASDLLMQFQADLLGVPRGAAGQPRDDGPRRRVHGRALSRRLAGPRRAREDALGRAHVRAGNAAPGEPRTARSLAPRGRAHPSLGTMKREDMLRRLGAAGAWDVVVVGGGATGLGVAVDAQSRGYRTLAPRAGRLRFGDLEPEHEARARRRPVPRAGRPRPRDGGPPRAGAPPRQRPARRPQPAVHRPAVSLVGGTFLRHRPEDVRPAGREVEPRALACPRPRGDDRPHPQRRAGRAPRRSHVLRRPVRRRKDGGDARANGRRPGRVHPQLCARHGAHPAWRRRRRCRLPRPRVRRGPHGRSPCRRERRGNLRRSCPPARRRGRAPGGAALAGCAPRVRPQVPRRRIRDHGPSHRRRPRPLRHPLARPRARRHDRHGDAGAGDGAAASA